MFESTCKKCGVDFWSEAEVKVCPKCVEAASKPAEEPKKPLKLTANGKK